MDNRLLKKLKVQCRNCAYWLADSPIPVQVLGFCLFRIQMRHEGNIKYRFLSQKTWSNHLCKNYKLPEKYYFNETEKHELSFAQQHIPENQEHISCENSDKESKDVAVKGKRSGLLEVIEVYDDLVMCSCTCGKRAVVKKADFENCTTISCGCKDTNSIQATVSAQRTASTKDRYVDQKDGTVVDSTTELQWMRCSLGQEWDGTTCVGKAKKFDWQGALDSAGVLNHKGGYAGHCDWRLPTIEELKSLVYCSSGRTELNECGGDYQSPTIDLEAFPGAPAAWFWSSSPSANYAAGAWYVGFYNGYVGWDYKSHGNRVRLVRTLQ